MKLRANVRRPGRYREDDVEDLPPNPTFVVPTFAFNPNLQPAVFPTLRYDELSPDHPAYVAKETVQEGPQGPAFVFRDTMTLPVMETEEGLVQLEDRTWLAIVDPGDFDALQGIWEGSDIGSETQERAFLPIFAEHKYWSDLSDGMRLIVVRELTAQMTFEEASIFLQLGEDELNDFLNLCKDEINLRVQEDTRVARMQERQMEMLDGDWVADGWGRIFDEDIALMGEPRMPSTFLITREEVAIAKKFLGNYRFREEYAEYPDENLDEIESIPNFADMSSLLDRLDQYVGVETSFKKLDFGKDFLEYSPEDVLVVEEVQEDGARTTMEVLIQEQVAAAAVQYVQAPLPAHPMPASSTDTPKENSTTKNSPKKDALTGLDVISPVLIQKRARGRPRKKDTIANPGPTRLREVMNAEDLNCPSQSRSFTPVPTIAPDAALATIFHSAPVIPTKRTVTPTPDTLSPRSVSSVARDSFKGGPPPTLPSSHCDSFCDDLSAQPAPSSPPKNSPPINGVEAAHPGDTDARLIDTRLMIPPPIAIASFSSNLAAQPVPSSPPTVSTASSSGPAEGLYGPQSFYMDGREATTVHPYLIFPANSLTVPVSSMNRVPSTTQATANLDPSQSQRPKKGPGSRGPYTKKSQSTVSQSTQSSPTAAVSATRSSSADLSAFAKSILDHMDPLSPKSTSASRSVSNSDPFSTPSPSIKVSAPLAHGTPPQASLVPTSHLNAHTFKPHSTTSQASAQVLQAAPKPIPAPTPGFGVLIPSTLNSPSHVSAPAQHSLHKTTSAPAPCSGALSTGPQKTTNKVSATPKSQPPETKSTPKLCHDPFFTSSPNSQMPAGNSAHTFLQLPAQDLPPSDPFSEQDPSTAAAPHISASSASEMAQVLPPQVLLTASAPISRVASSTGSLPQTPARDVSQTNKVSPPYVSPYKSPGTQHGSSAGTTIQSCSERTPTISSASPSTPPPKSTTKRKAPTTPQLKTQITPGKMKFNVKGTRSNTPFAQPQASVPTASEASPEERPRVDGAAALVPEERLSKKPRFEQQEQSKKSLLAKVVNGGMRAMSNIFTGVKDTAGKSDPDNLSDIINDPIEGSKTQLSRQTPAFTANESAAANNKNPDGTMQVGKVHLIVSDSSQNVGTSQEQSVTDLSTTPSKVIGLSTTDNSSIETPKTPTNFSPFIPDSPPKPRKQSISREEAAQAAGQTLLIHFAAQAALDNEAVGESAILRTSPSIISGKARFVATHSQTNSQSSIDDDDNNLPKQAKAATPETSPISIPAPLQDHYAEAETFAKKLGAPPQVFTEKTRSAAKHVRANSQTSTESVSNEKIHTPTRELIMPDFTKQHSKSNIEILIPPPKRAASEMLFPSFKRGGSPAKKQKTSEAFPTAGTRSNCSTRAKGGSQKKGPNVKKVKKPANQTNAAAEQQESREEDEISSIMTTQTDSGHAKKVNGKKVANQAKATAKPKAAPKSKASAQLKTTPQPRAAKTAATKPKATPKSNAEK